jgi:hypothetical protein
VEEDECEIDGQRAQGGPCVVAVKQSVVGVHDKPLQCCLGALGLTAAADRRKGRRKGRRIGRRGDRRRIVGAIMGAGQA